MRNILALEVEAKIAFLKLLVPFHRHICDKGGCVGREAGEEKERGGRWRDKESQRSNEEET